MQNSEIGNGLIDTVSRGLKGLFRSLGGKNAQELMPIEVHTDGAVYIMDGKEIFAGPYKTVAAAKGQRTRYLRGYSAASRRPNKG